MAQAFAQKEHRTMSEPFREALRYYVAADRKWNALLKRTHAKDKALQIKNEADVQRFALQIRSH